MIPPAEAEPFIIRPHHALNLYSMLALGVPLDDIVDPERTARVASKKYARDVYGETSEQTSQAAAGIRSFFTDFVELPDENPVRFVNGAPDGICNSCVIGKHCQSRPSEAPWSPAGESKYLRAIKKTAILRGIGGSVIDLSLELPDGYKTRGIEMPAVNAREVLGDLRFRAQTIFWPLRLASTPIARRQQARQARTQA